MNIFDFVLGFLVAIISVPVLVFFLEIAAAVLGKRLQYSMSNRPSNVVVVVPAHDEAAIIQSTLTSLISQLHAGDRLLVVADNCADTTAEIAHKCGAEVIERQDLDHRGKGFALQFAIDHLKKQRPPSIIIFVDADCMLEQSAINLLTSLAYEKKQPVQAQYLLAQTPLASKSQKLSAFAVRLKNDLRLRGDAALGIPSIITGSGITLPWEIASNVKLGTGNIVEDMALGIDLVASGHRPIFLQQASVKSMLPSKQSHQDTQRTRWEHGHLMMIPYAIRCLFPAALRQRSIIPLGYALVLTVPPLSLLVVMMTSILGLAFAWNIFTGNGYLILHISFGLEVILTISVLIAWIAGGRDIISFSELANAPVYAIRKLPTYIALFRGKPIQWIRTKRANEKDSE
jgi:cellulose synthase/poly-beta-1,6-N-acetylglucosamine synthase-like glycosyltransferase